MSFQWLVSTDSTWLASAGANNGKDKKGNKIEISDEILLNAYREISSFIASVYHCFFVGYVLENNL